MESNEGARYPLQLEDTKRYYWELNTHTKLLEKYDALTGKLVAIQKDDTKTVQGPGLEERQLMDGQVVLVEKGVDTSAVEHLTVRAKTYDAVIVEIICQQLAEGGSLTAICKKAGMPTYATLCRWRRIFPEVDQMLDRARKDRAEYLRDKLMEEAMGADEDTVAVAKLRVDTLKWAAGKDDPNKYEAKPDKTQVNVAPSVIIVQTGIDRGAVNDQNSNEIKDIQGETIEHAATVVESDSVVEVDDLTAVD